MYYKNESAKEPIQGAPAPVSEYREGFPENENMRLK